MSARCRKVVDVNDDDRLPRPLDIECGRAAVALVLPCRDNEWCACAEHAREAQSNGADVEDLSTGEAVWL